MNRVVRGFCPIGRAACPFRANPERPTDFAGFHASTSNGRTTMMRSRPDALA